MEKSITTSQKSEPVKSSENVQTLTTATKDNRPQSDEFLQMRDAIYNGPRTMAQRKAFSEAFGTGSSAPPPPVNNTGMPDELKTGLEYLSGMDLSDVKVHYNSKNPAQLQAHAYAQGNQIYLSAGQEKYLPHEGWHVVQQRQGKVKPTLKMDGVNVNDDHGLETEADVMGRKALQSSQKTPLQFKRLKAPQQNAIVQRYVEKYAPAVEADTPDSKAVAARFKFDELWNLVKNVNNQANLTTAQVELKDKVFTELGEQKIRDIIATAVASEKKSLSLPDGQPNAAFVQLLDFVEKTLKTERLAWKTKNKKKIKELEKTKSIETLLKWCSYQYQFDAIVESEDRFNKWDNIIRPVHTSALMLKNLDEKSCNEDNFNSYVDFCKKLASGPPKSSDTKKVRKVNTPTVAMKLWGNVLVSPPLFWERPDINNPKFWAGLKCTIPNGQKIGMHLSVYEDSKNGVQEVHFTVEGSSGLEGNYFADIKDGEHVKDKPQGEVASGKPGRWSDLGNAQAPLKKLLKDLFFSDPEAKPDPKA